VAFEHLDTETLKRYSEEAMQSYVRTHNNFARDAHDRFNDEIKRREEKGGKENA